MTSKNTAADTMFDLSDVDTLDTADMEVYHNGSPTGWIITFAGPGHEKTIAQSNRLAKERIRLDRERESAQINGRKWKPAEETVEELQQKNVTFLVERIIGWSPVKIGGQDYPFSRENAMALFLDRKKHSILSQALEFLGDERSFTSRSAIN